MEGTRSKAVVGSDHSEVFTVNSQLREGDGLFFFNLVLEKAERVFENIPGDVDFDGPMKELG